MRLQARFLAFCCFVVAVAACSTTEPDQAPRSSARGRCISFSPHAGYSTCLLSEAQTTESNPGGTAPRSVSSGLTTLDAPLALPKVDLREKLGKCIEVHDQGMTGWCVMHATTAALEVQLCERKTPARVSPSHLAGLRDTLVRFDAAAASKGWAIEEAADTITRTQLVSASLWPFIGGTSYEESANANNASRPADDAVLLCKAEFGALSSRSFRGTHVAEEELAAGRPVVVAVPIHRSAGWAMGGPVPYGQIADPPAPAPTCSCKCEPGDAGCVECATNPSCIEGYHAVLLVGYDSAVQRFTFLNSWGTTFGDQGYGSMSYELVAGVGSGVARAAIGALAAASPPLRCSDIKPVSKTNEVCYRKLRKENGTAQCKCGEYRCRAQPWSVAPQRPGCGCEVVSQHDLDYRAKEGLPPYDQATCDDDEIEKLPSATTTTCCMVPNPDDQGVRCRCTNGCEHLTMTRVDSCSPADVVPEYFSKGTVLYDSPKWLVTSIAKADLEAAIAAGKASWLVQDSTAFCDER